MMAKLIKVRNTNAKLSIKFDHKIDTCYGKNASLFRSYMTHLGHQVAPNFVSSYDG